MRSSAAALIVVAALAGAPLASSSPAARAGGTLDVVTDLPAFLAPGGRLVVAGWAGSLVDVELNIGDRVVARTTSGPAGRFRFDVRVSRRGLHFVSVWVPSRQVALQLGWLRVRAIELVAVGDVTFGGRVADAIAEHGPRYPWLAVAPILRAADLAAANLEGVVSTRGAPWPGKKYHFRGSSSALAAAARFAGLDVVSLANNHSLDFGRSALLDTIGVARRLGLRTVGGGRDLAAARRPALFDVGGLRLAFLAYSDVRPPGFDAGVGVPGAAPAFPELIDADVRAARQKADLVVVFFHWGIERARTPNERQHSLAATALDAGATVVLGAHPHVLQPVVPIRGRRLVAWSLGNFVFPASSPGTADTGILIVHLTARGVAGHRLVRARLDGIQPRLLRA